MKIVHLALATAALLALPNPTSAQSANIVLCGDSANGQQEIFKVIENPPRYTGDLAQLAKDLNAVLDIPKDIKGDLTIQAIVNCRGQALDFKCTQCPDRELCEAVLREMPLLQRWKPGTQRGVPKNVMVSLSLGVLEGKLLSNFAAAQSGALVFCGHPVTGQQEVFKVVENPPQYIGGLRRLAKDLNARLDDIPKEIKGHLIIQASVNCHGKAFDFSCPQCPDEALCEAVLRQMPLLQHWKPGTQGGVPRNVERVKVVLNVRKGKLR